MTTHKPPPNPDVVVSTSAAVGGFASVFAWAACCVLPLALSLAGVSFAGAAVIAGARTWLTAIAALVLVVGWLLHWRRVRKCRTDVSCARPSRTAFWLLVLASVLVGLALVWGPFIEPWAMCVLMAAR